MVLKQLSTLVCLSCLVCTAVICENGEGIAGTSSPVQFKVYDAIRKGDAALLQTTLAKHTRQLTKETIADYTIYAQSEYASLRSQVESYHPHRWALLTGITAGCTIGIGWRIYNQFYTSMDNLNARKTCFEKVETNSQRRASFPSVVPAIEDAIKKMNTTGTATLALAPSTFILGSTFNHWREQVSQQANLEKRIAGVQECLKTLTLCSQENEAASVEEKIA